jgi:hypothetical protein
MERFSEKVADFLKAVLLQVDGRQNDQKASLKICKAWVAAMLNAQVARQAKECTDPKLKELLKPFEEALKCQLRRDSSAHEEREHRTEDAAGANTGW